MKKTGFNGYIYDFSVDNIKDIHKYLMKIKKTWNSIKMFKFLKRIFASTMMFFSSLSIVDPLECLPMKNQEWKVRPEIVNISSNDPIFYPFIIKVNKCSGNCNNISDPYAKICVPDIVKNLNVKVFNLMTLTNEARHIKWHETCKCICRLDKLFVIVNNDGIKINVDVSVKN